MLRDLLKIFFLQNLSLQSFQSLTLKDLPLKLKKIVFNAVKLDAILHIFIPPINKITNDLLDKKMQVPYHNDHKCYNINKIIRFLVLNESVWAVMQHEWDKQTVWKKLKMPSE